MNTLQVTSLEQLKQIKTTHIINLGEFEDGTPLIAELKKPSLLKLITSKHIPNSLMKEATKVFNNKSGELLQDAMDDPQEMKKMIDLIDVFAHDCLVSPKYQDILDLGLDLTMDQKIGIMIFTSKDINALKRFREEQSNNKSNKPVEALQCETEPSN